MNFFHHKDLGNHLLQLCPKVVKHPVCMYVCMCVCMYLRMCMYVCMYICMYVRTYVCMYVLVYVEVYLLIIYLCNKFHMLSSKISSITPAERERIFRTSTSIETALRDPLMSLSPHKFALRSDSHCCLQQITIPHIPSAFV